MAIVERVELRISSVRAHQEGRLREALDGYTRYLERYPTDAGVWTNLGSLYRTMGRHEMGRTAQMRANALAPDDKGIN
jgi:Flp pilus assembly protein TadD